MAINILVFLIMTLSLEGDRALALFYWDWGGLVPAKVTEGLGYGGFLTSMFLHGGFMHLAGNMLFLFIFGDNLEDELGGHLGFVLFYVASGLGAAGLQFAADPTSLVPMIGASGAIAGGVMGGYLLLFPRARVDVLIIIIIFFKIFPVPAWLMLAVWFALQLFNGAAGADAGIAYWAMRVASWSVSCGSCRNGCAKADLTSGDAARGGTPPITPPQRGMAGHLCRWFGDGSDFPWKYREITSLRPLGGARSTDECSKNEIRRSAKNGAQSTETQPGSVVGGVHIRVRQMGRDRIGQDRHIRAHHEGRRHTQHHQAAVSTIQSTVMAPLSSRTNFARRVCIKLIMKTGMPNDLGGNAASRCAFSEL